MYIDYKQLSSTLCINQAPQLVHFGIFKLSFFTHILQGFPRTCANEVLLEWIACNINFSLAPWQMTP